MISTTDLTLRPGTIGHSIINAVRRWPDRTALVLEDRQSDHRDLSQQILGAAKNMLGLGIAPGEHVGILMPNCWDYVVLTGALNMIGAGAVVLNSRYRGEDLKYVLKQAQISHLFISGLGRPHVDLRGLLTTTFPTLETWSGDQPPALDECPKLRNIFHFQAPDERVFPTESHFEASGSQISHAELCDRAAAVEPEDIALIIFSSGTTAHPKACMISHRSVTHVAGAIAERLQLTPDDVFWDPLPLYHLSSHLPLNACRQTGATFVSQSHFEPAAALAELERVGATICYPAFPALTAGLIDHPDFRRRDLSRLRAQINIGAPEQLAKFAQALPHAKQISCYGLTECGGIATMSCLDDSSAQRVERAGLPLTGHSVRIIDPETLNVVPAGTRGEIAISGPIFSGYFDDDAQTKKVMLPDGWLRSGDLGWIDADGQLAYAGRIKDMLKIGGENVAAVEVESFLSGHPKIKMAQVIPAPDDRLVEVVAAFIELNSGETMSAEEVIEYCVGAIASYKIPRYVRFVRDWPMSTTKIQKFMLVDRFVPDGKIDVASFLRSATSAKSESQA